jgi:hypothetical protein
MKRQTTWFELFKKIVLNASQKGHDVVYEFVFARSVLYTICGHIYRSMRTHVY